MDIKRILNLGLAFVVFKYVVLCIQYVRLSASKIKMDVHLRTIPEVDNRKGKLSHLFLPS